MAFLQSFRLNQVESGPFTNFMDMSDGSLSAFKHNLPAHSQHPNFLHLTELVFEAVLEVVVVSAPGYIVARAGGFNAEQQKFLANLNVQLFTPCLIFSKLASQLTAEKLVDLAIIPLIFVVQTLVSYICARVVAKICRFKKRQTNFVVAMGVFGNSNSLPISLVISLAQTLKGLHWDKIPGDNDDEVAARGILYLLIFQQLGQLVRWSWGYNVLLKPKSAYPEEVEGRRESMERGEYRDAESESSQRLLEDETFSETPERQNSSQDLSSTVYSDYTSGTYASGTETPQKLIDYGSESDFTSSGSSLANAEGVMPTPMNGNIVGKGPGNMAGRGTHDRQYSTDYRSFPSPSDSPTHEEFPAGPRGWWLRFKTAIRKLLTSVSASVTAGAKASFNALPVPLQKGLATFWKYWAKFWLGVWDFMNPPLWAMLIAVIVASIPPLQKAFFTKGSFIENSVTRAISQSGGVAVPLILVVLGGNLARNTLPASDSPSSEDPKVERKLLIASLISRMVLPTLFMAPMLALTAKYIPVSIVDDKIFIIVCFLLTGAPSALQLAQICQMNDVYMGAMSSILFQSYVVWILPSTLVLVMLALETVEWATQ